MARLLAAEGLAPGFADPVHDAQGAFRVALAAFAHPGRVETVPAVPGMSVPERLGLAATALALTLLDLDTPLWLSPAMSGAADYLRFHCGCPVVTEPAEARFVIAGADLPALECFDLGTDEYPDRAATMIIVVEGFDSGPTMTLSGPGIKDTAILAVDSLPDGFWAQRMEMQAMFPRGVDLVFACGSRLVALPRSTRVKEA